MYLGMDLGTSGLKVLLMDEVGQSIASVDAHYSSDHAQAGWSEQDPTEWIEACKSCMQKLKAQKPDEFARVLAIGISGHMHGATMLDANGDVLHPCILWNDTRSFAQAAVLDQTPNVRALSGNIVFPGFTAPKLLWMKKHKPEIFDKIATVLLPAAYLGFWLTGEYVADMSDSAGTSWLDVQKRDWSDELLAHGQMRKDQMPRLVEGCEVAGQIRAGLARELGLNPSTLVVGGGGDNAVAACGVGTINEGDGFVSLGTSGVILAARSSFTPDPASALHTFCHALPKRWYQMGVMLSATDSLNWLSRLTGQDASALAKAVGEEITGPSSTRFLPYLSGERTPHNDADIRGAFIGLDIASDAKSLTKAVMEGVAFGLRDSFEALKLTGVNFSNLLAIGGGSRSHFWLETLATVFNHPIALPANGDFGAAKGAARLAMIGAGKLAPEAVITLPEIEKIIHPKAELVAEYDAAYQKFTQSYKAIKAIQ